MRSNGERRGWLRECGGGGKQSEKREKSWWKRLGLSCVSAAPSPCSAVDGFDCEHEGGKPNPAGLMKTGNVSACVCVSVHHHPPSVLLSPARTQIDKLSSNCLFLQLSNLIIFSQVAFCSASVICRLQRTPFSLFSASSPSLAFQWLAVSGPCFCSVINNSGNRTTQRPSVRAWMPCSDLNCPSTVWRICVNNGFVS